MTELLKLGEREWEIRPLTLRQLRMIVPLIGKLSGADFETAIDVTTEILCIALSRIEPGITIDTILDLEVSVTELLASTAMIARSSGMQQGEAPAVVKSNGGTFMDSSPPPVDIATQRLMK